MGQAVVDLPDPMHKSPAGANSADDLLSQLAGDEIDRLLTEADAHADEAEPVDPPVEAAAPLVLPKSESPAAAPLIPPHEDSSAAATVESPAVDTTIAAATPAIAEAKIDADDAAATADTATIESATASTAADLDAILNNLDTTLPAAVTAPALEGAPLTGDALDQAVAAEAEKILTPATAEVRADLGIPTAKQEADERQELLEHVAAESAEDPDTVAPLPLLLRPLEWFSAPLDGQSDAFREFLGKAALLTLVNSAAVIAYVLIFRHSSAATASASPPIHVGTGSSLVDPHAQPAPLQTSEKEANGSSTGTEKMH